MKCPVCKKYGVPVRIGTTIGAGQLTACRNCGVVFCEAAKDKVAVREGHQQTG